MNSNHLTSDRRISLRSRINIAIHSLSLTGKLIFYILLIAFGASALSLLWSVNAMFMVEIPVAGGTITEGVIGVPRFVNPVLAVTDSDRDISALVYSGLMHQKSNGELVPDLAENYSISPDGKEYTFTLKQNIFFHDDKPVTADDVVYTVTQVENLSIKSPKRANWDGITVEKIDDRTVKFTLKQPYSSFLENTTLGILPKHLWQNTTAETFVLSDLNTQPIGSGPFKINETKKSGGVFLSYELEANPRYALGKPLIKNVIFKFYPTEKTLKEAYLAGDIDSINSISPETAVELEKKGGKIYTASLPRVFGVYFNQTTNEVLALSEVRNALDMTVDRDYIVRTVLQGYGTPLKGPVPERFIGTSLQGTTTSASHEELIAEANKLLDKAGWVVNANGIREKVTSKGTTTLAFSISTSDVPELKQAAKILKDEWHRIGADVEIKVFEVGDLSPNIIRPRKYDALLFGQIVNRDLDLYIFWHSSQKNDPGLNIALYSSIKADKALENIKTMADKDARLAEYEKFIKEIGTDRPAVFIYSPDFIYLAPSQVKDISIDHLSNSSERFDDIITWHIETAKVWRVFAQNR